MNELAARIEFTRIELPVASETLSELAAFYADWGRVRAATPAAIELTVGPTVVAFTGSSEPSFHHFALQLPGDRFDAAQTWLAERAPLRSEPAQSEPTFHFENIDAVASYVLDPAGNIVELIAFPDLRRLGQAGPFDSREMLGVAEIGLVVLDRASANAALSTRGLETYSGSPQTERREFLQFVGERGRSIILASPARRWLPTYRPAELSPAAIEMVIDDVPSALHLRNGRLTAELETRTAF